MRTFERDGKAHVEWYDASGKRQRASLGVAWGNDVEVAKALARKFGAEQGTTRGPTLEQVYLRVLATPKPLGFAGVADKRGVDARWRNDVREFFAPTTPIGTITTSRVAEFQAWLIERGNDNKTVNRKVSLLSKLLTCAAKWDLIGAVPVITWCKESEGRVRWLTDEEERDAIDYLRAGAGGAAKAGGFGGGNLPNVTVPREGAADMALLVPVLIDTGLRLSEALRIEDSHVRLGPKPSVNVWRTKNGRARTVPLTSRAAAILAGLERRDPVAHAKLPGSSMPFGNLTVDRCGQLWSLVRAHLGMQADPDFVIHALRHTFAVRMVDEGVDIRVLQVLMGHSRIETTMVYAHVSSEASRGAVDRLEARAKARAKDAGQAPQALRLVR